jgi:hypothetical protein
MEKPSDRFNVWRMLRFLSNAILLNPDGDETG